MNNQVHTQIVSFIWSIADDCLRDVYVRGKYRDVILPMTVIRRLDAMLEGTIENVRNTKKLLDEAKVDNQWPALCNAAGQPFCNASPFLLKDLTSRASKQKLKTDFETYLDGFSPNVQEILEKFKFRNQIATMVDADILGSVIEKFVSSDINLSPNPVYKDDEKTILKHPGLDNHGMGTIFEELIRKFNEENNEEAGEHWTPRDVVELMADLIFIPIADQIKDATYTCYDGACGTGGMLTVAQDRLQTLATRRGKNVSIHLFGQEVQPETYAICKADMLLKGDGEQVEHIVYGSTLSAEPDTDLRDTENIPFTYEGGIEAFMQNEVLTYARYSIDAGKLALDLCIFINGLPVITFELKNQLTKQNVENAVQQYKDDRSPKEQIFSFKRCMVHFAVDDDRVKFCTKLAAQDSWFLPFDNGSLWKCIRTSRNLGL